MNSQIIGVAGRKASGKSTLAKNIAAKLSWPCASFGAYVRHVAQQRGLAAVPEVLQDLGASLIESDCPTVCEECLRESGWVPGQSAVVEGIRHIQVADELARLALPGRFVLVFLDVPDDVLLDRLPGKGIMDAEALEKFEAHSTETDVKQSLKSKADLVLDGLRDVEGLASTIIEQLNMK